MNPVEQCDAINNHPDAYPLARGVRCANQAGHTGRHVAQYPADPNDRDQTPWLTTWGDES